MKRDLDVVRAILLAIEENGNSAVRQNPSLGSVEPWVVGAHVEILIDAGLLTGIGATSKDSSFPEYLEIAPTWAGYEFLDSVRDRVLWRRTKEAASKIGSCSFSVLVEVAKGLALAKARELGFPI